MAAGQERLERKLAAIFAADVAGYSRLMSQDEAQTLRALTTHREKMDRLIGEHGGRIANTAGDSVLAEFPSAVDAVHCAVEVQKTLADLNTGGDPERAMLFRIGIHVGDVMVRGGDLLGDGVNIAARLEALAPPGGVCISGDVHRHVRKALPLDYLDLGPQPVKNIDEPIHAYAVAAGQPGSSTDESHSVNPKPFPLIDRPSIAVLPFTNMSGDPEQEYFADGISEDLLTALSRLRWLFVIARNSSFVFKGKAVDVKEVGRQLGVRYVLEGSVRKAGTRVRITGQLIEAATGAHLWTERYDRNLADIFDVQDEITQNVVAAIEPSLQMAEIQRARAKRTEVLGAYDLYLRALPELYSVTQDGFIRAEALLREAIRRDPDFAGAVAALADCLGRRVANLWTPDVRQSAAECCELALRASDLDPEDGSVLATAAWALGCFGGSLDHAEELAHRALRLHPNSAYVRTCCGYAFAFAGNQTLALDQFEAARRISPLDPREYNTLTATAFAYFNLRQFDDALQWTARALERRSSVITLLIRAAAFAHLGRDEEARSVVARLLEVQPTTTLAFPQGFRYRHEEMRDLLVSGLRRAGLPE